MYSKLILLTLICIQISMAGMFRKASQSAKQERTVSYTDYKPGVGPGAVVDNVNLMSLQSSYAVPLGALNVRGQIQYPLTLTYSDGAILNQSNRSTPSSWVGMGWNLSFPFVARAHMGTLSTSDDALFCNLGSYGGGQLTQKAGSADEFYLVNNPNIKIKALKGNGSVASGGGVDFAPNTILAWEFIFPDGKKMILGDVVGQKSVRYQLATASQINILQKTQYSYLKALPYRWDINYISDWQEKNVLLFTEQYTKENLTVRDNLNPPKTVSYIKEGYPETIAWKNALLEVMEQVTFELEAKLSNEYVEKTSDLWDQSLIEKKRLKQIRYEIRNEKSGFLETKSTTSFAYQNLSTSQNSVKNGISQVSSIIFDGGFTTKNDWMFTYESKDKVRLLLVDVKKPDGMSEHFGHGSTRVSNNKPLLGMWNINCGSTEANKNFTVNNQCLEDRCFIGYSCVDNTLWSYTGYVNSGTYFQQISLFDEYSYTNSDGKYIPGQKHIEAFYKQPMIYNDIIFTTTLSPRSDLPIYVLSSWNKELKKYEKRTIKLVNPNSRVGIPFGTVGLPNNAYSKMEFIPEQDYFIIKITTDDGNIYYQVVMQSQSDGEWYLLDDSENCGYANTGNYEETYRYAGKTGCLVIAKGNYDVFQTSSHNRFAILQKHNDIISIYHRNFEYDPAVNYGQAFFEFNPDNSRLEAAPFAGATYALNFGKHVENIQISDKLFAITMMDEGIVEGAPTGSGNMRVIIYNWDGANYEFVKVNDWNYFTNVKEANYLMGGVYFGPHSIIMNNAADRNFWYSPIEYKYNQFHVDSWNADQVFPVGEDRMVPSFGEKYFFLSSLDAGNLPYARKDRFTSNTFIKEIDESGVLKTSDISNQFSEKFYSNFKASSRNNYFMATRYWDKTGNDLCETGDINRGEKCEISYHLFKIENGQIIEAQSSHLGLFEPKNTSFMFRNNYGYTAPNNLMMTHYIDEFSVLGEVTNRIIFNIYAFNGSNYEEKSPIGVTESHTVIDPINKTYKVNRYEVPNMEQKNIDLFINHLTLQPQAPFAHQVICKEGKWSVNATDFSSDCTPLLYNDYSFFGDFDPNHPFLTGRTHLANVDKQGQVDSITTTFAMNESGKIPVQKSVSKVIRIKAGDQNIQGTYAGFNYNYSAPLDWQEGMFQDLNLGTFSLTQERNLRTQKNQSLIRYNIVNNSFYPVSQRVQITGSAQNSAELENKGSRVSIDSSIFQIKNYTVDGNIITLVLPYENQKYVGQGGLLSAVSANWFVGASRSEFKNDYPLPLNQSIYRKPQGLIDAPSLSLSTNGIALNAEFPINTSNWFKTSEVVAYNNFYMPLSQKRFSVIPEEKSSSAVTLYSGVKSLAKADFSNAQLSQVAYGNAENQSSFDPLETEQGEYWSFPNVQLVQNHVHNGNYAYFTQNEYGPTVNLAMNNFYNERGDLIVSAWMYVESGSAPVIYANLNQGEASSLTWNYLKTWGTNHPVKENFQLKKWQRYEVRIPRSELYSLINGKIPFKDFSAFMRISAGNGVGGSSKVYVDDIVIRPSSSGFSLNHFDEYGRLIGKTNTLHKTERYELDAYGQVIAVRDDKGLIYKQNAIHRLGDDVNLTAPPAPVIPVQGGN